MLIPKTVKKETVENPFRPKTGIPPTKTKCKFSLTLFEVEFQEFEERVSVDATYNEDFITAFKALIPQEDRNRCLFHEVWIIPKSWKQQVVELAHKHFDEVIFKLRKW